MFDTKVFALEKPGTEVPKHLGKVVGEFLVFAPVKLSQDGQVCVTCFGFWELVLAHHIEVKIVLVDGWRALGTKNELVCVAMRPNVVEPTEWPLLVARKKLMGVRCCLINQVFLFAMEHLELSDKI